MSTRYIRTRYNLVSSLATDYSRPFIDEEWEKTFSLEETPFIPIEAATTGTTVTLSDLSSCSLVAVYNEDSTNYVLVTARMQKATKTFGANKLGFTAVAPCTITDDDSTFLTSLYFAAGDLAVVTNATEAANNGTFLVQTAAAGTLTVANATAFTLDADDAGTPTIASQRDITIRLAAGDFCMLPNLVASANLTLTANTAAVECRVFYAGT